MKASLFPLSGQFTSDVLPARALVLLNTLCSAKGSQMQGEGVPDPRRRGPRCRRSEGSSSSLGKTGPSGAPCVPDQGMKAPQGRHQQGGSRASHTEQGRLSKGGAWAGLRGI